MSTDPNEDLGSLPAILPRLNAAIAEANAVVHALDQFFAEELPVGPWVTSRPFDTQRVVGEDGRELLVASHLACGRVGGAYRLHILSATLDRADGKDPYNQLVGEERTPWLACPKSTRLQSFAMLPELLGLLAAKVNEITLETNRTVETVRGILRSVLGPAVGFARVPEFGEDGEADPEAEDVGGGVLLNGAGADLFKRPRVK
jgi:hypothetical protein